jgi:hypothetical protein
MNTAKAKQFEDRLRGVLDCFTEYTRPYSKKKLPQNIFSPQDIVDGLEDLFILDQFITAASRAKAVLEAEKRRGIARRPLAVMAEELSVLG